MVHILLSFEQNAKIKHTVHFAKGMITLPLNYIDLFAGAGGLSEGFADIGCRAIAHVEMNADACNTLRTRECYRYLYRNNESDIYRDYLKGLLDRQQFYSLVPQSVPASVIQHEMSRKTMRGLFTEIDRRMADSQIDHVDLIVGGPPCQAYSQVGRSRKDMSDDPRNVLYRLYMQVLMKYQPEMFVFENVPGLLTAGQGIHFERIGRAFGRAGYAFACKELNAAQFGVLQNRKRLIFVGWRKHSIHCFPDLVPEERQWKVWNLLSDLPVLEPGQQQAKYKPGPINKYLGTSGIRKKGDILTWHVARVQLERDREIYRRVIDAWNENGERLKYDKLPDELKTHNNTTVFKDRFKVVAKEEFACQTMMAHISKDGHYFIHPDRSQARSITVREAARIQSFPDDFYFEGSRTAAFVQIGNAVPPLFAKKIARAINAQFGGDGE